jgi:uncharacterized protein YecE (DUF72 family)
VPTRRRPPSGGNSDEGRAASARVLIGTSGWSYQHWVGRFYPKGMSSGEWLSFYAERFPTVEINNTFYRLPSESMVRVWHERTPPEFRFAVKGSRFVTHFRKLRDSQASVEAFVGKARLLAEKLGVILWQLPPDLPQDTELLDAFLALLPDDIRQAVEFRNPTWLAEETYAVLRAHNAANVHVSSDEMPMDLTVTAGFVYVRFHGLAGYHGAYVKRALGRWADFLAEQSSAGRDAYAYFNNDWEAHAPADAARLRDMVHARE